MEALTVFERAVIEKLLDGDHPQLAALREQVGQVQAAKREVTGRGFFCDLDAPAPPAALEHATFMLADVEADLEGVSQGASFVLVVKKGRMTLLECFTHDEPWPERIGKFELRYASLPRDLDALE